MKKDDEKRVQRKHFFVLVNKSGFRHDHLDADVDDDDVPNEKNGK